MEYGDVHFEDRLWLVDAYANLRDVIFRLCTRLPIFVDATW